MSYLNAEHYTDKQVLLSWSPRADVIVERSRQRAGNYSEVTRLANARRHIDRLPARINSRDEFHYRVKVIDSDGRDIEFGAENLDAEADKRRILTNEDGTPITDEEGTPIRAEQRDELDLSEPDAQPLTDEDGKRVTDEHQRVIYVAGGSDLAEVLGPVAPEVEVGSRVAHIRRQTERHLRRVGEKAYLFEEADGKRCPDCWDEVRRVRKRSKCDTCGGSGYVQGWSPPIEIRLCIGAGEPSPKETQGGEVSTLQLKAWTGARPEVSIGDHVVRARDREVFRVVKRRPTKKEAHDLRQNLIFKMVERGSKARQVTSKLGPRAHQ